MRISPFTDKNMNKSISVQFFYSNISLYILSKKEF